MSGGMRREALNVSFMMRSEGVYDEVCASDDKLYIIEIVK